MITCFCISMLLMLAYLMVAAYENKRRDKEFGKPKKLHNVAEGFMDVSDKRQTDFRYTH